MTCIKQAGELLKFFARILKLGLAHLHAK